MCVCVGFFVVVCFVLFLLFFCFFVFLFFFLGGGLLFCSVLGFVLFCFLCFLPRSIEDAVAYSPKSVVQVLKYTEQFTKT